MHGGGATMNTGGATITRHGGGGYMSKRVENETRGKLELLL